MKIRSNSSRRHQTDQVQTLGTSIINSLISLLPSLHDLSVCVCYEKDELDKIYNWYSKFILLRPKFNGAKSVKPFSFIKIFRDFFSIGQKLLYNWMFVCLLEGLNEDFLLLSFILIFDYCKKNNGERYFYFSSYPLRGTVTLQCHILTYHTFL